MTKAEEVRIAKHERAKLLKHKSKYKGTMQEFADLYGVTTARIYKRLKQAKTEAAK